MSDNCAQFHTVTSSQPARQMLQINSAGICLIAIKGSWRRIVFQGRVTLHIYTYRLTTLPSPWMTGKVSSAQWTMRGVISISFIFLDHLTTSADCQDFIANVRIQNQNSDWNTSTGKLLNMTSWHPVFSHCAVRIERLRHSLSLEFANNQVRMLQVGR